jgi:hypothetical protein
VSGLVKYISAIEFKKLDNRDEQVAEWIFKELCHQGWEPYAVRESTVHVGTPVAVYHYFRLRVEDKPWGANV